MNSQNLPIEILNIQAENEQRRIEELDYKNYNNFLLLKKYFATTKQQEELATAQHFLSVFGNLESFEDFKQMNSNDKQFFEDALKEYIVKVPNAILYFKKSVLDFETAEAQTDLVKKFRVSESLIRSLTEKLYEEKTTNIQKVIDNYNLSVLSGLENLNQNDSYQEWDMLKKFIPINDKNNQSEDILQFISPKTFPQWLNNLKANNPSITDLQVSFITNFQKLLFNKMVSKKVSVENPADLKNFIDKQIVPIFQPDGITFNRLKDFQLDVINIFLSLEEVLFHDTSFKIPAGFKSKWRGDVVERRVLLEIVSFIQTWNPNDKLAFVGLKTNNDGSLFLDKGLNLPSFKDPKQRPTYKKNIIAENDEFTIFSQTTINELIELGFLKSGEVYNEDKLTPENKILIDSANREKPDFILYHKTSHQLVIGMVQTDLNNGGAKTNRADKYINLAKNLWKLKRDGVANISFAPIVNDGLEIKNSNSGKKATQLLRDGINPANIKPSDLRYYFIDQLDFVLSRCVKKTHKITDLFTELGENSICYQKWLRFASSVFNNLEMNHNNFLSRLSTNLKSLKLDEKMIDIKILTEKIKDIIDNFFLICENHVFLYVDGKTNSQETLTSIIIAFKKSLLDEEVWKDTKLEIFQVAANYFHNLGLDIEIPETENIEKFATSTLNSILKHPNRTAFISKEFLELNPVNQKEEVLNHYSKDLLKEICNIDGQTEDNKPFLKFLDKGEKSSATWFKTNVLENDELSFKSGFEFTFQFENSEVLLKSFEKFLISYSNLKNLPTGEVLSKFGSTLKVDEVNKLAKLKIVSLIDEEEINSMLNQNEFLPVMLPPHPIEPPSLSRMKSNFKKSFKMM